ncbi:MAG: NADH:flavin oxidoreductase/NADH oxidase family protein [Thermodesulfobacteriota bacterium]
MNTAETRQPDPLATPVELPCGAVIKNRFMKSAMSEIMGTADNRPTARLERLYNAWAWGGAGVAVTGNVMVDAAALGEPRNVVIEDGRHLEWLRSWAKAGRENHTHIWVQLNHPGKQSPKTLSPEPVAPSAVPFSSPTLKRFFNPPRELLPVEIEGIIERFANAADIARQAGFTGVQIHAAHGYLISQFLSPQHNLRTDEWGGCLENRMRFLLEIYRAIRGRVGDQFPVAVKINSADFMRGGFTEEEALQVVGALAGAGIDLVEISGGTYESPAMAGRRAESATGSKREAYFLSFAAKLRESIAIPLAVTGGFRTADGMRAAVDEGALDMVGLARPMAIDPELPNRILQGEPYVSAVRPLKTGVEWLDKSAMLEVTWYEQQLARIAAGKPTLPGLSVWKSLFQTMISSGFQVFQRRRG